MSVEGWKEAKLTELVEIIGGGTPKTSVDEYWNGEIPWLSVKDFNSDARKVYKSEKSITKIGLENSSTKVLNKDDIIISARGTVGALAQLGEPMAFNQSCYGLRANSKTTNDFIYYTLRYKLSELKRNTHGSVFDTITRNTFDFIKIFLPSLSEQKVIAATLSAIDDTIELNNQINKTLEEMAQAIFKSWFVDFEPFKDGEFEESELGLIPKGWRVVELKDIVDIVNGFSYKGSDLIEESNNALVTIKNFQRGGGFKTDGFKGINISDRIKPFHYLHRYDLIVAHTDLTQAADIIGNPVLILTNGIYKKLVMSMDLVKVVSRIPKLNNFILYMIFKDKRFKAHAVGYSSGTTVLHLSKKAIPDYKVALPKDMDTMKECSLTLEIIYNEISMSYEQNKILFDIRDTLLPKLMSGEIRVPVEEVV